MLYLPLLFIFKKICCSFFKKDIENWKRLKKDHGNYLGDGENVLYSKTLRLSKEKSVWKVYIHFTKWKMPSAKGFISLSEEDISRAGVQKKQPGKFRLAMRHAILMLTIITHCKWLQSEMVGPPPPDTLQGSRCLSVAHYSRDHSEWNYRIDISDPFWYRKCQISLQRTDGECEVGTDAFPWKYVCQLPCPSHSNPS